jgi:hypothetical protein
MPTRRIPKKMKERIFQYFLAKSITIPEIFPLCFAKLDEEDSRATCISFSSIGVIMRYALEPSHSSYQKFRKVKFP